MKRIHIIISGKVIGVLFRANTKERAISLGLKGFVRNVGDKVEIVVEGDEVKIEKLIEFCKKGPAGASVSDVEVKEEKFEKEFDSFEVKYS